MTFTAGLADKILMVRNKVGGYDLVVSKGVKIPHDTDVAQMVAVQLGVPQDNGSGKEDFCPGYEFNESGD